MLPVVVEAPQPRVSFLTSSLLLRNFRLNERCAKVEMEAKFLFLNPSLFNFES